MSYLYSRYLKKEKKTGASCRLPAWNMGKCGDGMIVSEEEVSAEEEMMPEEALPADEEWTSEEGLQHGSERLEGYPGTFSGTETPVTEAAGEEEFCESQMPGKTPVPRWMPGDLPEEDFSGREEDMVYFRTLYPSCIRRMKDYVEEECDHLDGPGGLIYDEYPDRVRLRLARDRIFARMKEDSVPEAIYQEELARDVAETLLYQEILARRASGKRRD